MLNTQTTRLTSCICTITFHTIQTQGLSKAKYLLKCTSNLAQASNVYLLYGDQIIVINQLRSLMIYQSNIFQIKPDKYVPSETSRYKQGDVNRGYNYLCRETRNTNNSHNNNSNNSNVYIIKRPYLQEPFKGDVQIICNLIIPQTISVKIL